MLLKSWRLIFLSRLLVVSELIQSVSMKKCPECTDVCSDATNITECTELVKKCTNSEESSEEMCYIDGADLSAENIYYLAFESSFYSDKVKVIFKGDFPNDLIFVNVKGQMSLRITSFIISVLCGDYAPVEETCRQNTTSTPSRRISMPSRLRKKILVRNLKISFSCIKNFTMYEPLALIMEGVKRLDLTANLLEEIPTNGFLGLSIEEFIISCNRIKTLTKDSFKWLENVTYLDLSTNYITEISENSFEDMHSLKVVNLSRNFIVSLRSALFHSNNEVRIIDLAENQISNLKGFLDNLTELEEISFENNSISELPKNFFNSNRRLKVINFQGNSFQQLPNLTLNHGTLNLAHNLLRRISLPLTNVKNASKLDLSSNCLQISFDENKRQFSQEKVENLVCQQCCLDNHFALVLVRSVLVTADLRYNQVNTIDIEFLTNVSHLKTVMIGYEVRLKWNISFAYPLLQNHEKKGNVNPKTVINISDYSFLECDIIAILRHIENISQPPKDKLRSEIRFELYNITVKRQRYADTASARNDVIKKYKDLVCEFLYYCPALCECYTKGLDPSVIVNCSGKGLTRFPNMVDFSYPVKLYLSENKLTQLPTAEELDWNIIQELYLKKNGLEQLENLPMLPNFCILQLQNNKMQYFSPVVKSILTSRAKPKRVWLSGNPWKCACNATDMKNLMIVSENVVDFDYITCQSLISGSVLFFKNVTRADVCESDVALTVGVSVFAVFLFLTAICVVVIYCFHAELRLWLFTHGYCLRFVAEEEIDAERIYDAFISYSSHDEEWVGTHLVPGLESGFPSYTLCVHERDWPAGEFITEMIYKSLKQSRRTIIVLTDNYVSSEWCRFEFRAAHSQSINDGKNRLLAVVPENVPDQSELVKELQAFITLKTYLKWDDPYFWRKLRCSMPRVNPRQVESCDKDIAMLIMNEHVNS